MAQDFGSVHICTARISNANVRARCVRSTWRVRTPSCRRFSRCWNQSVHRCAGRCLDALRHLPQTLALHDTLLAATFAYCNLVSRLRTIEDLDEQGMQEVVQAIHALGSPEVQAKLLAKLYKVVEKPVGGQHLVMSLAAAARQEWPEACMREWERLLERCTEVRTCRSRLIV